MTTDYADQRMDRWGKRSEEIFDELLREMGIFEHAYMGGAWEGTILPTGLESMSEAVMTSDDMVSIYMLAWDQEKSAPDGSKGYYVLRKTITYSPERMQELQRDSAYIEGRKKLGLPVTEEQEKILKTWEAEHA